MPLSLGKKRALFMVCTYLAGFSYKEGVNAPAGLETMGVVENASEC